MPHTGSEQEYMLELMQSAGYEFLGEDEKELPKGPHVIYRAYYSTNDIFNDFIRFEYDVNGTKISETKVPIYQSNDDDGKACFYERITALDPKEQMKEAGYEIKDVAADGNCFYHAVAKIINSNSKMLEKVKANVKEFETKNKISYKDLKALIGHTNDEWATDDNIKSLVQKLQVSIAVYVGNKDNGNLSKETFNFDSVEPPCFGVDDTYNLDIINLYNTQKIHFEPVMEKKGNKKLSLKIYNKTDLRKKIQTIPANKEFECELHQKEEKRIFKLMSKAGYAFFDEKISKYPEKAHIRYRIVYYSNGVLKDFIRSEFDENGQETSSSKVKEFDSKDYLQKECFFEGYIVADLKGKMRIAGYKIEDLKDSKKIENKNYKIYSLVAKLIRDNKEIYKLVKKNVPSFRENEKISADDLRKLNNDFDDKEECLEFLIQSLVDKIKVPINIYRGDLSKSSLQKELFAVDSTVAEIIDSGIDEYNTTSINLYCEGDYFEAITKKEGAGELKMGSFPGLFPMMSVQKVTKKEIDKSKKTTVKKAEKAITNVFSEQGTTSCFGQAIQAFHDNRKIEFPTYFIRPNAEQQNFMETFKNRHNNSITTTKHSNNKTLFKNTDGENIVTQVKLADNTLEFKDIKKSCTIMVKHSSGNGFDLLAFNDKGNLINNQCVGNKKYSLINQKWLEKQPFTLVIEGAGQKDDDKQKEEKATKTKPPFRYKIDKLEEASAAAPTSPVTSSSDKSHAKKVADERHKESSKQEKSK
jgi:hypothetical protein